MNKFEKCGLSFQAQIHSVFLQILKPDSIPTVHMPRQQDLIQYTFLGSHFLKAL